MNPMMNPTTPFATTGSKDCGCHGRGNHKVPRMPIMIDQVKANPLDVRPFIGKPLHTVLDTDAIDGKMLQIFTSKEAADKFALSTYKQTAKKQGPAARLAGTPEPTATPGVPPDGGYIELFEHINFAGCAWYVTERDNHTVGNYGDLWACGFLWWGWKHANNTVSAIDVWSVLT